MSCMGLGCPQYLSQGLMYKMHDKHNNKMRGKKLVKYPSNR